MRVVGVIALLFLAACEGEPGFEAFQAAPARIAVAGGSVTIAGPPGYCIDRSATRNSLRGVFVLLGSCASIANNAGVAAPQYPAVLTASVSGESGAGIKGSSSRLSAFFRSEEGRSALARDGQASSVRILSSRRSGGMFIIRVRDTSPNNSQGLAQEYWRVLLDVRGRIVTLSVFAFKDKPMSNAIGLATLKAFAARVSLNNPTLAVEDDT